MDQETNKEIQETQKKAEKRVNIFERVSINLYNTSDEQGKTSINYPKTSKCFVKRKRQLTTV